MNDEQTAAGAGQARTGGVWGLMVVAALAWVALFGSIVWASMQSHVGVGLAHLVADRWGIATLIDVYAGALVVALWMLVCERHVGRWLAWVVALALLGHLVSLTYVLVHAGRARTVREVFAPGR